ncbi:MULTISPECIES: hypothetical protein [Sphingomonas]|uniref:hypothetical protein n=1 Tax=Sphingomonas TaxID=13687 RepID=UPI000DEF6EA8|nr:MULTISPECIES: hypothetical protein [Sphingomonas]
MTSVVDRADRLAVKRANTATSLAIVFLATQGGSFNSVKSPHLDWPFLCWVAVLLTILMFGGGWFQGEGVRAALNDETTRAHRRCAMANGFVAALVCGLFITVLNSFVPLETGLAVRVLITASVSAALLQFGKLERRALRDG